MKSYAYVLLLCATACAQPAPQNTQTSAAQTTPAATPSEPDTLWTTTVEKSNEEWKKILTPEQYYITREQGTERPFSSPLYDNHEAGIFLCVCCKNPLFSSETKFNSGTGWPSFFAPYATKSVAVAKDDSHGMVRDEISCMRCHAHLGHVFDDGPAPTGLRYCIDGVALEFWKSPGPPKMRKAVFAAGCFWCEEAVFESIKGVQEAVSGYAGGTKKNPTYEEVGSGTTGHAESVEVRYDSSQVTYPDLLRVFFASQDPTQVNGQGPDIGTEYRSIVFYGNAGEKQLAGDYIRQLGSSGKYSKPIATEVAPLTVFWPAEGYHQNYLRNHPDDPYVRHESLPRLRRTLQQVPELVKPGN